jgi:hypothetical protein
MDTVLMILLALSCAAVGWGVVYLVARYDRRSDS